ncbi:RsmD family RNA methyltransferase [Novosphingobium sp.]|uniref:RsmD family RNA methyltransferase n=1 Tax=Novosphingobium sp. TaxID=1874826 RepID=UPI003BAAEB06
MAALDLQAKLMVGAGWDQFGLIDSGDGRKLERYGPYRFIRPEPQAMWAPRVAVWDANGEFVPGSDEDGGGRWTYAKPVPREGWPLDWRGIGFIAQCTPFRHLGFFPDMAPVWDWMGERLVPPRHEEGDHAKHGGGAPSGVRESAPPPPAVVPLPQGGGMSTLNMFGYTGVGTMALSRFGPVTHVDASKKAVAQARANAAVAGLEDRPVRWIVDDAAKFAAREVRRGKRYDGIILDPPKFGRGPDGEVWRLEENLPTLIADCARLLDAQSRFLFLTVYAVRMSSLAIGGLLAEALAGLPGTVEHGELALAEEGEGGRILPTAIFARWSNPET